MGGDSLPGWMHKIPPLILDTHIASKIRGDNGMELFSGAYCCTGSLCWGCSSVMSTVSARCPSAAVTVKDRPE